MKVVTLPMLSLRGGRIATVLLALLGLAAAVIFGMGSLPTLKVIPLSAVANEYGLTLPNSGRIPGGHFSIPISDEAVKAISGPTVWTSLNGHPAHAMTSAETFVRELQERGPRAEIVIKQADGRVQTLALTRSPANARTVFGVVPLTWGLSLQWGLQALNVLVSFAAAFLLLRRRAADPVVLLFVFQALVFAATSSVGWAGGRALGVRPVQTVFDQFANMAIIALPFVFPDRSIRSPWLLALVSFNLICFLAGMIMDLVWAHQPKPIQMFYTVLSFMSGPTSILALSLKFRGITDRSERQQIKAAMFSIVISSVLGAFVAPLAAMAEATPSAQLTIGLNIAASIISTLSSLIVSVGFLVSLLRYRLYDADRAISRSLALGSLTVCLVAVFTLTEKVVESFGQTYLGNSMGAVGGGLATACVALTIAPLNHWLGHWMRHRFQKRLMEMKEELPVLVGDMRETASRDALARTVAERVEHGVTAAYAALLIDGRPMGLHNVEPERVERWSAEHGEAEGDAVQTVRTDPDFPLRVPLRAAELGRVGWLLLGPRPDGSFYPPEERKALAELSAPIARAFAVVREREAKEAAQTALWKGYADRLAKLEALITTQTAAGDLKAANA